MILERVTGELFTKLFEASKYQRAEASKYQERGGEKFSEVVPPLASITSYGEQQSKAQDNKSFISLSPSHSLSPSLSLISLSVSHGLTNDNRGATESARIQGLNQDCIYSHGSSFQIVKKKESLVQDCGVYFMLLLFRL